MTAVAEAIEVPGVDFADPPANPPAGCVDPVMWGIAEYLFHNHVPGEHGECSRCCGTFPCLGRSLADTGLRTAMGEDTKDSAYWRGYAHVHGPVR